MKVVLGSGGPPLTDSAKKKKKTSLLFGVRGSLKSHLSEKIAIRMHRRFQSFSGGRSRKDSEAGAEAVAATPPAAPAAGSAPSA